MTEHEFENYIMLLGSFLRLDDRQRETIGWELRDHLEERMADLVESGVSRPEAVRMALAEWGDAGGLAQQFVSIGQRKRRRWMMRFATFSIAGSFVAALLVFSLWPEQGRVTLTERSTAQEQVAPTGDPKPADSVEVRNVRTRNLLDQSIMDVEFVDHPFGEVLDHWRSLGMEFYVDASAEMNAETPVTIQLRNVRLSTAIELLLREHDAGYIVRDGLVLIASLDALEDLGAEIRVYNCRDLLRSASPKATAIPFDLPIPLAEKGGGSFGSATQGQVTDRDAQQQLVNLIIAVVTPSRINDEAPAIEAYDGLIVANESAKVHEAIEDLLTKLRNSASPDATSAASRER